MTNSPNPNDQAEAASQAIGHWELGNWTLKLLLLGIFAGALAIRLWGIRWGLSPGSYYTFHPDEGVNLTQGVLNRDGTAGFHLTTGFYNYGTLYFYLWQILAHFTNGSDGMYLSGRLLTAMLGALTVFPVYALGARLFGRPAGIIAGAFFAIIPAAVVHAHFATVDVPATFFVACALAAGARLLDPHCGKHAILAGALCGLAGATKYNTGLVIVTPIAALIITKQSWRRYALLIGAALIVFLIACPAPLIDWSNFLQDLSFEIDKSRKGMGALFEGTGNGWLYHLNVSLRFAMGVPLLLAALAGVLLALIERRRGDLYLLVFFVGYYLLIGAAQVRFMRYVIPLFPILAVWIGRLVAEMWNGRKVERGLAFAVAFTAIYTLPLTQALDRVMTLPDPRDQARDFIRTTLPRGSVIGFATVPWYWSPTLDEGFKSPSPQQRIQIAEALRDYTLRIPPLFQDRDMGVLAEPRPAAIAISDLESEDWERLKLPDWQEFKRILAESYTARIFENLPSYAGYDFGKPEYVPNDLLYIYPRVTVYVHK